MHQESSKRGSQPDDDNKFTRSSITSEISPTDESPPSGTELILEIRGWFEPNIIRLKEDLFALVRRSGLPQTISIKLDAPRYAELREFIKSQVVAQKDSEIARDQQLALASASSALESTEQLSALLLTQILRHYGIRSAIKSCDFFLRICLARIISGLASYQVNDGNAVCTEFPDWFDLHNPMPTLTQFVYGHSEILEVILSESPSTRRPKSEKVFLQLDRIENDGGGGIITNLWEPAIYLPQDIWIDYVVPQLAAMKAQRSDAYLAWIPDEAIYCTEGIVWKGAHSFEWNAKRIGDTHHAVLNKGKHHTLESSSKARQYLELITDPPTQQSGPFLFFHPRADVSRIKTIGEEVLELIVAVDDLTWRAPTAWHAAVWLRNIAGGAAEGKEVYPNPPNAASGPKIEGPLLFYGGANIDADLRPTLFLSDDQERDGNALLRFMLAMSALNEALDLHPLIAEAYIAVAQHYKLLTYLISMTLDPFVSILNANINTPEGGERVVYWISFNMITALGGKIIFPPLWAERLYDHKELYLDFKEVGMTDLRSECYRILFPADPSYSDFEFVDRDEAPDHQWLELARQWAVESQLEVNSDHAPDGLQYANDLCSRIGRPAFLNESTTSERIERWCIKFVELLNWLMLKRNDAGFYIDGSPLQAVSAYNLGLLNWFAQDVEKLKEVITKPSFAASRVKDFISTVRASLKSG